MDSPKFVGITFRSVDHMLWFQRSIAMMLSCAVSCILFLFLKSRDLVAVFLFSFGTTYAFVAIVAAIVTKFGKKNGPMFSRDCIWFNGLLSGIYFAAMFLARFLEK